MSYSSHCHPMFMYMSTSQSNHSTIKYSDVISVNHNSDCDEDAPLLYQQCYYDHTTDAMRTQVQCLLKKSYDKATMN